jgi:hypothetical protein
VSTKQSLLTHDTALTCGQIIQAALPDTSYYTKPGLNGAVDLFVCQPRGSYQQVTSVIDAGRYTVEALKAQLASARRAMVTVDACPGVYTPEMDQALLDLRAALEGES